MSSNASSMLRSLVPVARFHGPLQIPRSTRATIPVSDARLELLVDAVQQRVACCTDTRRVIAVLVGKRTPFGSSIDDVLAHDESAIGANQIARVELFGQIRWVHLAVTADQTHVEVGNKVIFALGCITTVSSIPSA